MVYAFRHAEESTWVTLNLADVQKRRDKLKVGPTHEKVWAALRWHENSHEERSWHMGRHETRWKELRCEVWRVQCDVWGKCLLDVALHRASCRYYWYIYNINIRRKFRSQTSDNMDRWKAEVEQKNREEKSRREKIREEKVSEERRSRCPKR